jgi:hypothetical protein
MHARRWVQAIGPATRLTSVLRRNRRRRFDAHFCECLALRVGVMRCVSSTPLAIVAAAGRARGASSPTALGARGVLLNSTHSQVPLTPLAALHCPGHKSPTTDIHQATARAPSAAARLLGLRTAESKTLALGGCRQSRWCVPQAAACPVACAYALVHSSECTFTRVFRVTGVTMASAKPKALISVYDKTGLIDLGKACVT